MRILVSGAGMAGLSAGITLGATGHHVTIVERAGHLRVNGSPIDIRGDAVGVARTMGILERIQQRRVTMTARTRFVDADGTVLAELPGDEVGDSADDVEIPREDLARVLRDALGATTSLVFGDSISELHDGDDGVDVTFESGRRDHFDLVVGADGMHSLTRRLVFGPEPDYLRHLGFYVALTAMPAGRGEEPGNPILNWPGHMIGITRYGDVALGVMTFRSGWIDYDYRDSAAQKRILAQAFGGHDEWRVPEILDAVRADPELYFDSVSQIHMPGWSRGHVVLVGDAAHCASGLSGRGTSLALTGTWLLAQALREHPDDLGAALHDYETRQRPYVTHAQASAGPGADLVVPATQQALDARNARLRTLARPAMTPGRTRGRAPSADTGTRPRPAAGIRAENLTKKFGGKAAVDNLSFTAAPGRITGFLGPNGAGKSTTMRMLFGLTRATAGTITIGGRDITDLDDPARTVGALLDARAVHPQRTAAHHLLAFAQAAGLDRRRVGEVLDLVGLRDAADRRAGEFSLGMQQRLGIATALLGDPGVLVLDEPLNGLDPEGIRWIRTLMRDLAAQGRTILFSSHLMSEMELTADDLVVVGRGRLVAETTLEDFVRANTSQAVAVRAQSPEPLARALGRAGLTFTTRPDSSLLVTGTDSTTVGGIAAAEGIALQELGSVRESLEDVFLRLTHDAIEFEGVPA